MRRALGIALPAVACLFALLLVVPALLGYHRYVVASGSMTGTYDRGSVVFSRDVGLDELRVGDVVTFRPPGARDLVTHRIVALGRDAAGALTMRTKGDANPVQDPWTVTPAAAHLPRAAASVPYVGFAVAALGLRWVRLLVITLPALLIAAALAHGLWREADVESRVVA